MSKSITFGKKSRVRFSTSAFLSLLAIFAPFIFIPTPAQALDTCVSGSLTANANNIAVEPSHGKVLYIDTGVSPRIDGAYIGYRVKNTTGSTISGWWVSLTNFTGGVVNLANSHDQYLQLPDIANNATKTVYFLLKASTSTKISQKHSVNVYNGRPDASTSTSKFNCEFSFTKVAETIKAAANKVTSITVSGNFATGQLVTVVAKGATGTIGAGSPDVGKILWFSPSAFSNFPTSALRLESVTLVTDTNPSVNSGKTYNERLLITPSITPDAGGAADDLSGKRYYENSYKFRVLNKTSTATGSQTSPSECSQ